MLFWTVQTILISFILIFLVHHLITYFKQILTVPKTKDLVNTQIKKYQKMLDEIQCSQNTNINTLKPTITREIPKQEIERMNNELSDFIMNDL
jgi:conjugal transfer/entry exclusion protein